MKNPFRVFTLHFKIGLPLIQIMRVEDTSINQLVKSKIFKFDTFQHLIFDTSEKFLI